MNEIEQDPPTDFPPEPNSEERALAAEKEFAAEFARQIIAEDFVSAHRFLTPWLQAEISPARLREAFENELREMNGYWDLDELIFPANYSVSWNSSTLDSLKEPMSWREPRSLSDMITRENFRRWMVIEFLPDENDERVEFDGWFDFWCVIVEADGELKIGFFEFEDVD
jgi:hypothetical protein